MRSSLHNKFSLMRLPVCWACVALCLVLFSQEQLRAKDEKTWEMSPYRVQLQVVVDSHSGPPVVSAAELAQQLDQRIRTAIFPLWKLEIITPEGSERVRLLTQLEELDSLPTDSAQSPVDKVLVLTVEQRATGVALRCREFDAYLGRWSPTLTGEVRQDNMLTEQCFELVCRTFAPLAIVRVLPEDEQHVLLSFQGSELAPGITEDCFLASGNVFQPLIVRLSRTAGEHPVQVIDAPWTYVVATKPVEHDWQAEVLTGTRRPFGARRRQGIEIMALAMKTPLPATRVRFHATHDVQQALSGYDVFLQTPGEEPYQFVGQTDLRGSILVEKQESPVTMLTLRCDMQPLAKVPVVAGSAREVDVPIADDVARLRAQEQLNTLKEELIDTVARRTILMARIRQMLKDNDVQGANNLLAELDNLPKRSDMDRQFELALQSDDYRSKNPRIQAKIDKLFTDTRALLGRFLNVNDIAQIEAEVREHQKAGR